MIPKKYYPYIAAAVGLILVMRFRVEIAELLAKVPGVSTLAKV